MNKFSPSHYQRGKIEVWDFIADQELDYFTGNVIKYLCRAGHKDRETELDDLQKAKVYIEKRIELIKSVINKEDKIEVMSYNGLTIDFCKKVNADFIVRGVRNNGDFEFEKAIARTNRLLSKIETVFLLTSAKTSFISSSIVRDLIKNNGDYSELVPQKIAKLL